MSRMKNAAHVVIARSPARSGAEGIAESGKKAEIAEKSPAISDPK